MTKRANGEGTVFKRGDGTWVVEITVPPHGTQPGYRKAFRCKSQRAVLARRAAFTQELAAGRPRRPRSATLGEYGDRTLRDTFEQAVYAGQLSDSTLATYRHLWNVHIAPVIGHVKFPELTPGLLQAWLADRAEACSTHTGKPFSVRTQQAAYALLRAVLNEAVRDGHLDRNPLSPVGVRAPAGQKPKVSPDPPLILSGESVASC